MKGRIIFPKAPDDRGWTRAEWKVADRSCRVMDGLIDREATAQRAEGLLYEIGCWGTAILLKRVK